MRYVRASSFVTRASTSTSSRPGDEAGRIGDVSAKGNFAFLTHYREPTCERRDRPGRRHLQPGQPKKGPYIPSPLGTYAGEGSQVVSLNSKSFEGDVLIYQNEICAGKEQNGIGGVTLVDVTNPMKPKKLVEGFGDFTGTKGQSQTHANQVHSAFGWVNEETNRAYVIMTDDEEFTDTDIIDITNPSRPKWVRDYGVWIFQYNRTADGPPRAGRALHASWGARRRRCLVPYRWVLARDR